jgi:broad specificity phosphatase PhoE
VGTDPVVRRPLHLVRHGRPVVEPTRPPDQWRIDPAGLADVDRLRHSRALPARARWFSSPERKALETARRLTDGALSAGDVRVVPELCEHRRGAHWFDDPADFRLAVRRAFADPEVCAAPTWEPLAVTRDRLLPAVRRILADHPDDEVVLAGHGTAWTLLVSELTGAPPDLDAWERLRMPDLWVVDVPTSALGQSVPTGCRTAPGRTGSN